MPKEKKAPRRGRPKKTEEVVEPVVVQSEESADEVDKRMVPRDREEDRVAPINFGPVGPRMGVEVFLPKGDVGFKFTNSSSDQVVSFEPPVAVRVTKEGGTYNKLEFFYETAAVPYSRFDNKNFLLITHKNPETGNPVGRIYRKIVCSGRFYTSLKQIPNVRLVKFVCYTQAKEHFNDGTDKNTPKHMPGLAAPYVRR